MSPTKHLRLKKDGSGYYTDWTDDKGERHKRRFGKVFSVAEARFDNFRGQWSRVPEIRTPAAGGATTLDGAWSRYKAYADQHYRHPDGSPTGEAQGMADAMGPLLDLFGGQLLTDVDALAIRSARERMISDGNWARTTINKQVGRIKRVWRWFASNGMADPAACWAIEKIEALQAGRSEAHEPDPVVAVPEATLAATLPLLTPTLTAMVRFLYWTGGRPQDASNATWGNIDTTGDVWVLTPGRHKNAWRGRTRQVFIGPNGQDVIKPLMNRPTDKPLFSPRDSQYQRRLGKTEPERCPDALYLNLRDAYTTSAFGYAIRKTCDDHNLDRWSPGQIRHLAATRWKRAGYQAEQVQAMLGHGALRTQDIYDESAAARAAEVIRKIG